MKNSATKPANKPATRKPANKQTPAVADETTPAVIEQPADEQPTPKQVRISLTQESKSGKVNASFVFAGKGNDLSEFITDTCNKIVGVMAIQARIKEKGGKASAFGLTKGGNFELNVTVMSDDGATKLLNNFVFNLPSLGTTAPADVLKDMVEGYKMLTE